MSFCSQCGHEVNLQLPEGDAIYRYVCSHCEMIHYQNPNIITGSIPIWEDKVLLCKRAIEPQKGYMTLPAGFMENYETVQEGAQRETWEEARAKLEDLSLFGVFNLPHISQVYMFFTGHVIDGICSPGPESIETQWFTKDEIPWQELAFPVITEALKLFFDEHNNKIHIGDIYREEDNTVIVNRFTS